MNVSEREFECGGDVCLCLIVCDYRSVFESTGMCAFCVEMHGSECMRFLGAIKTEGRFTGAIFRSKFAKRIC